jgi:seryl-tRNA synthetase
VIDIRHLRNDPETVKALMARRSKPALVDELERALRLDARLRDITTERDTTRQRVNELSKQVGQLRKFGDDGRKSSTR